MSATTPKKTSVDFETLSLLKTTETAIQGDGEGQTNSSQTKTSHLLPNLDSAPCAYRSQVLFYTGVDEENRNPAEQNLNILSEAALSSE